MTNMVCSFYMLHFLLFNELCRNRGHDGDGEQKQFFILQKQRSRHHSLLGKTMENQKQDKASSQNRI